MQSSFLRIAVVAAAILCAAPAVEAQRFGRSRVPPESLRLAARSAYFPLAVGNTWIYSIDGRLGSSQQVIEVLGSKDVRGVTYYDVEGLVGGRALLRFDRRGRLVEYIADAGRDQLWYDFAAPLGASWTIDRPELCFAKATIESRSETVKTPAGVFANAVVVDFGPQANCADAGLDRDVFAPGVGLVERTSITIAGPRVMRLRRALVGGKSIHAAGLSFLLRTDRAVYTPNFFPPVDEELGGVPVLKAELTLENTSGTPFRIQFNSGQKLDVVIRNEDGKEVWRWSDGRAFTRAIEVVEIGGVRTWAVEKRMGEDGRPWPSGIYIVEAELTNAGARRFGATVGVELTEPVF